MFDDIVFSRVLGANNHINIIGQLLKSVVNDKNKEKQQIINNILSVTDFFKGTRGQQSRAIFNAISMITPTKSEMLNLSVGEIRELAIAKVNHYDRSAKENLNAITTFAMQLTNDMETIMVFDYSSTVDRFLEGSSKKKVYIPESRALDGGHPLVKSSINAGHDVHFIPDTAMLESLKKCQVAFIGAETFYPDGSVFNTIGSDILAVLCQFLNKPIYVLTPMLKVDIRPIQGYIRTSPMPYDFSSRLASQWEDKEKKHVDFEGIKLILIPSNLITGYITEFGIIPSQAMYSQAIDFHKSLSGDNQRV